MGVNSRDNNINDKHVIDLISAYIDNALDAGDRERVRGHIATCELCEAEHRELLATQQMLRAMPVQVPPRVFTLTEEMVGARRASEARPSLLSRMLGKALAPRLATGSVLAFALLLVILVSDLGVLNRDMAAMTGSTSADSSLESDSQQAANQRMMAAAPTTAAAAATEMHAFADQTATTAAGGGGGGANASAVAGDSPAEPEQANTAPPQPTPPAVAGTDATPATEAEAPPPGGQGEPEPTVMAVADDQPEGTPSAVPQQSFYNLQDPGTDEEAAAGQRYYAQSPGEGGSFPATLAIEVALAVLGIGLAIGAILARRRGA